MDISITKKQQKFIDSEAFETLFGGAAGGGRTAESGQSVYGRDYEQLDIFASYVRVPCDWRGEVTAY